MGGNLPEVQEGLVVSANVEEADDSHGQPGDMPGILKSLEDSNGVPQVGKMAVNTRPGYSTSEGIKDVEMNSIDTSAAYTNGLHESSNGVHINGSASSALGIQSTPSSAMADMIRQLPPEIEHITLGYLPLSTLITRLAQETFNDLADVINDMSDMRVPQPSHYTPFHDVKTQINGQGTGNSQENVEKKLRMLDFAQNRRAQFIKILVLSQWSRRVEEVSKVIDMKIWLDGQKALFDGAVGWMGQLKRKLALAKMPNPDIKTALEVLSVGHASWLPDLGYIPPEALSPQQMLKALHNINTLLSIRLNLHESIPPPFRDFSITSGRVTFHVLEEFEVDLSIAEEDPSAQLYFIDFRFLFSPTPTELPPGRFRDEIEGKANDILKREGLRGCFDFLHDLVLTHKVSILRHQAFEFWRGHWSEHLKVEAVHRSLVVQYWLNRPGGKNWVEIGIKRRKGKRINSSDAPPVPYIAMRWFCGGKEVTDFQIDLGLSNLCFGALLKRVIAKHTCIVFQEVAAKLRKGPLYSERLLGLKQRLSTVEPIDAALLVQLTLSKVVSINLEPVTGRFALSPASPAYSRAEWELNNLTSPAVDAPLKLATLRAVVSQEEFEIRGRCFGWECIRSFNLDQETRARLFPRDALRLGFFRRRSWNPDWILALATSLGGDSWWVVELPGKETQVERTSSISRARPVIRAAYRISMPGLKSFIMEPSYATFALIERSAASMIANFVDTRYLTFQGVLHKLQQASSSHEPKTLIMKLSERKSSTTPETPASPKSPSRSLILWTNETVALTFQGIDQETSSAIHIASACMERPISNTRALTSSIDSSIAFHPTSGAFAFRLQTPVGELTIPSLHKRLSNIERLVQFLHTIKRHRLRCNAVSLNHLEFIYTTTPTILNATLHFPTNGFMRISFPKSNPHLRIQDFLTKMFRRSGGLNRVLTLLPITLPLLRILSSLEGAYGILILPRSPEWYHVRYRGSRSRWEIRLRLRRGDMKWFVKDMGVFTEDAGEKGQKVPKRLDVDVEKAMIELEGASGDGWQGISKGSIAATPEGVEEIVTKIDELFRTNLLKGEVLIRTTTPCGTKRKRGEEDDPVVVD